ncbi:class I SAM-dependent methyltransferase [Chloroflexus sp.]|uniref:class I SAM-dependent methyltransferase n=1 Tax=Chloroflexus sp. TaxID=1904827 RepID=UPI00298EF9F1|nr:class I SAM-dependent methyltransferase [Chloroflexus sp.]MCS6886616.1 class I SAM-dependent methyltransferase [Chloroflexus sp.]MDW8403076.1 class I SAM-dependent methyltransferase [Chloroflexus sp.]
MTDIDQQLAAAIDPWLQHMKWRRDFAAWRERRLQQERYQDERLAQARATIGDLRGARVLDLGAGMGGFAVAAALAGARVTACEYNPAYCRIIRLRAARYDLRLPIINAAGEGLPLPSAAFDLVVAWDVLEHVQDPVAVLREIARVLRPGGHALITAINRRAWIDPHYHMRGINWLPRPVAEALIALRGRAKRGAAFRDMQRLSAMHYFHYHELVRLCERLGFAVTDLRERALLAGQLPSRRPWRRAARAALRQIGLEQAAYRWQRRFYTGMFELDLRKEGA